MTPHEEAREALRKQLTLIQGGGGKGPVSRFNLRDRFTFYSRNQVILMFTTKLLLLASVLYFIYG